MKHKTFFINSLIICALSLFGYGIGQSIGNSLVGEYNPPWDHYLIQSSSKEMVDIVHVDIQSTLEDPTGDILYVATKNGEIYSNTLFQSDWLLVDPVPTWDNNHITTCATEWAGPTESHMWDHPPVEKGVMDSAGVRFERPVSTIARCYVLSDDGSLEVWVHSGNAMDLIANDFLRKGYAILGGIIGIIFSVLIIRFKKRKTEHTT